jgi:hypothetical protein
MVIFEDVAGWESPAAVVTGDVTWGPDARVQLDSDLNVSRGGVLSIEAGSVVKLGARVDIDVAGAVVIRGTMERPVVFAPADRTRPWGGFVLRGADARLEATGALLTGSGADPNWFDNVPDGGSSHRDEQPLVYLSDGARAELTDCFLVDNFGQAGHGEDSFLTLTRCLVQRCVTAGQYNGGSVRVTESALIEFPSSDAPFADDDNDALYLTGGEHFLEGSLVGWALDDGVDAGSGAGGAVSVTGCWFESCYHEAMAWSEERVATVRDTVAINNGQGIECGFGQPQVDVRRTLSTANVIGARFGDNYDWGYDGFLRVEDSLLLHNRRDVWGLNWDDWTWRVAQMDIRNNHLSQPAAPHPQNTTWRPASHGERLAPFLRAAATPVGVGIASRAETVDLDLGGGGGPAMDHAGQGGVAVRLSRFTTRPVSVAWHVLADGALLDSGTLRFDAGETVEPVPLDAALLRDHRTAQLRLERPVNAEISGRVQVELTLDGVTPGEPADVRFLRGDGNGDGRVDTADATAILLALFVGNDTDCRDALDANDSGDVDLSDPLAVLRYLYLDGVPLPEPFAMPGVDPTEDGLDCDRRS